MTHIITLFALISIIAPILSQQYLPKERGVFPVDDTAAPYIARSEKTQFWTVDKQIWNHLFSAYPLRPGAVTKVEFNLVVGNSIYMGVANFQNTRSLIYTPVDGKIQKPGSVSSYATPGIQGDNITMTVDLRSYENTISFSKNGLPLGIAGSGFNRWNQDIYISFGIYKLGHRVRIVDYYVQE